MFRTFFASFLLFSLTSTLAAAPLNRQDLPPGITKCFHMNFELVREFDWLQEIQQHLLTESAFEQHLAGLPDEFQFLNQAQLHDVTYFELPEASGGQFVLVMRADFEINALQQLLRGEDEYAVLSYEGHRIHHFSYDEKFWHERFTFVASSAREYGKMPIYVTAIKPGRIAMSPSLPALRHALDVLCGRTDCLSPKQFAELSPRASQPMVCRFHQLAYESSPTSELDFQVVNFTAQVDERLHLQLTFDTSSVDLASMVVQYAQPATLRGFLESVIPEDGDEADAAGEGEEGDREVLDEAEGASSENRNMLTLGMGFNGKGSDLDEAVDCILQSVKIDRDGSLLHVSWSSYADLRYTFDTAGGRREHRFMVDVSNQLPERTATKTEDEVIRRR